MVEDAPEDLSKVGMFEAGMVVREDIDLTLAEHLDDLVIIDVKAVGIITVLPRLFPHETWINDELQEFFEISEPCPMMDGHTGELIEPLHVFPDCGRSSSAEVV